MASNKILFILHFPPPVHGSSVVGQYIKESKIINNTFSSKYVNLSTSRSIDEIGRSGIIKISRYLKILFSVFYQLIYFRPHLVYIAITAKGPAFYKDAIIALMVKVMRFDVVYHFHNKGVSTRQNKKLDNFLYKKVFYKSKAILLSKYLYNDISKYFDKKNIFYCPNGIPDTANNYLKTGNMVKNKNDVVKILFLSNLIESKGVFVLLDALSLLKVKSVSFKCTIVGGEGDISESVLNNKLIQLDLNNLVKYAGKKFGKKKYEIYQSSDIFVFPTFYHNECFPLVLLEAMQFELPVISTPEGGIPDIVEDDVNGFLVKQKDPETLAKKLELLINNPSMCKKMGTKGKEKYENQFTLEIFGKNMVSALSRILSKG